MDPIKQTLYRAALVLSLLLQICACSSMPGVAVETQPTYDALFSNQEGWTGGDGVYSVALNDDTIAWLFGDTWVGQVEDRRHVNAALVNNSAAIQQGRKAATAKIRFFFGRSAEGQPAALIKPDDGRGWFWIFDGVKTPGGLYVFLIQIERTPGDAVFGFKVVGTWLGHVANPEAPPAHWHITQTRVPWSTFSASGGILWGSSILAVDGYYFIYGTIEEGSNYILQKHMVLARVPERALADFSKWRFYADGLWVSDFKRVSRISANMPHEYSVTYIPALRQYAAVYSEDGLSNRILLRLSTTPQGPWREPIQIYQCPEAEWDDSIFCYAAKAHEMLSTGPDRLIITYVASSVDFDRVANDTRLYRPRFLEVTFKGN